MATKKEKAQAKSAVKFWLRKIDKATETLSDYKKEAERAYKAAHDTDETLKHSFNIHWSSCAILRSAIYAKRPKPDVRRRYQKPNPVEKELAKMVERAIEYNIDVYDFEDGSSNVVRDYVEVGLGVPRLVYEVKTQPLENAEEIAAQLKAAGIPKEEYEDGLNEITSQCVKVEHIPWSQFLWEPGKAWKDIDWIAFKTFKSRRDIEDEYGVTIKGGKDEDTKLEADKYEDMATVWEIWHKPSKKIYVICPNHPEKPLDEYDDELNLSTFFPVPMPLMANVKHDELIPKPDYCFVEPQLKTINRLASRIFNLADQIKDISFYDSGFKQLSTLYSQSDGAMVPVDGLKAVLESFGTGGAGYEQIVYTAPNDKKVQVIRELQAQLDEAKEQLYEVYGISDIVRGASKASETATAQQIKANYANVRLNEKQGAVAMLWRNFFRMMAEVICERFDDMQLQLMTGVEITPEMREIMDNDVGRMFAIDIETDSTIMKDEQDNRQQVNELVETLIGLMERLLPAVTSGAVPAELAQETILFALSTHKHAKNLEDVVQGLVPHLEGQQQQQMMQLQQQLQEAMQANEQMQQQLAQVNEREEQRKDRKEMREDMKARSDISDTQVDNAREAMEAEAEVDLTKAKTAETLRKATEPQVVPFQQ